MRRQGLAERVPAEEMLDVAASVCGLHAQVMSSAELTLWARVDGLAPEAVADALWERRTLVKTWAMRGTLHLLPAREYPLWQAGLSTYEHYRKGAWLKAFGVTLEQLDELAAEVAAALRDEPLTREELAAEVARATGSPEVEEKMLESWGAYLKPAAFQGKLCFAPSDGRRVRFTHPASWLGEAAAVEPGAALEEITRRYLSANGPATREDLGRWWGVSPAKARRMIDALGDEVAPVDVEGVSAYMLAADARDPAPAGAVRLLPAFDQWVVGASRGVPGAIPDGAKERIYRQAGWLSPVLLVDGRMAGVWRHERKGRRLVVEVEPFERLPAASRTACEAEAERLAGFLGGELASNFG